MDEVWVTNATIFLIPIAVALTFAWCLARGIKSGHMRTIYLGMPSAWKADEPRKFWLLAGFNLVCLCGSIWTAFDLHR